MSGNGVGIDSEWPAEKSATIEDWWSSAQRFRELAKVTRSVRDPHNHSRYGYGEPYALHRVARLCARMASRSSANDVGGFW